MSGSARKSGNSRPNVNTIRERNTPTNGNHKKSRPIPKRAREFNMACQQRANQVKVTPITFVSPIEEINPRKLARQTHRYNDAVARVNRATLKVVFKLRQVARSTGEAALMAQRQLRGAEHVLHTRRMAFAN